MMMNYQSSKSKKVETTICAIVLGCIPLILPFLYCLIDGGSFRTLFLPDSGWNDELMYYKMTEAILDRGYPAGFYGFNESHAKMLSFASWSPLLLLQWILYGKLFGWGLISPFISNIVAVSLALVFFAFFTEIDKQKTIIIVLFLVALKPFPRYLLSCIPEPEMFALMIVYAALCIRGIKKKSTAALLSVIYMCVCLMTCMRPYLIVLFLMPLYLWTNNIKRKREIKKSLFFVPIIVTSGLITATSVLYVFISKNFTAEYTEELFYTDWIRSFINGGPIYGFTYFFGKIYTSMYAVYNMIVEAFSEKTFYAAGLYYLLFLVFMAVLAGHMVYQIVRYKYDRSKGKEGFECMKPWLFFEGIYIISMIAFILADLLMYRIEPGGRHTLIFIVGAIVLFPFFIEGEMQCKKIQIPLKGIPFILAGLTLILFLLKGNIPYEYKLSYADNKRIEEMSLLKAELSDKMVLSTDIPSFDNTVIWTFGKDNTCYSEYYAIPASYGINLVYEDIVYNNFENLQSRYIGVAPGCELEKILMKKGAVFLAGDRNINIYKLH